MTEPATADGRERSRWWLLAVPVIYTLAGPLLVGLNALAWLLIGLLIAFVSGDVPLSAPSDPRHSGRTPDYSEVFLVVPVSYSLGASIYPTAGFLFVIIAWIKDRMSFPIAVIANGGAIGFWIFAEVLMSSMRDLPKGTLAELWLYSVLSIFPFGSMLVLWLLWRWAPFATLVGSVAAYGTLVALFGPQGPLGSFYWQVIHPAF